MNGGRERCLFTYLGASLLDALGPPRLRLTTLIAGTGRCRESEHDEPRPAGAPRDYIDARVRSGEYGNTSEYLRDLIRRDQHDQAARRLRELITDGLEWGPATPLTKQRMSEFRKRALSPES